MRTLFVILFFAVTLLAENKNQQSSVYNPIGKRDPFKMPTVGTEESEEVSLNPIEKYAIEKFKLRAILRGFSRPRAMFEDPQQKMYILGEGDVIGREKGVISRILNREVIITEKTTNYLGETSLFERVLSLPEKEKEMGFEGPEVEVIDPNKKQEKK